MTPAPQRRGPAQAGQAAGGGPASGGGTAVGGGSASFAAPAGPGQAARGPGQADDIDAVVIAAQLGRQPRGVCTVAHRCPCGLPDVIQTAPRLPDGTPFPTLYYLTCPRAAAAISRLEAAGLMREMTRRLADDPALRPQQLAAHRDYVGRRDAAALAAGVLPLPPGTPSAGGMPGRVKCLHALAAHELACAGANALGREAIQAAGRWWAAGPCVPAPAPADLAARAPAASRPLPASPAAPRPAEQSSASSAQPAAGPQRADGCQLRPWRADG